MIPNEPVTVDRARLAAALVFAFAEHDVLWYEYRTEELADVILAHLTTTRDEDAR